MAARVNRAINFVAVVLPRGKNFPVKVYCPQRDVEEALDYALATVRAKDLSDLDGLQLLQIEANNNYRLVKEWPVGGEVRRKESLPSKKPPSMEEQITHLFSVETDNVTA